MHAQMHARCVGVSDVDGTEACNLIEVATAFCSFACLRLTNTVRARYHPKWHAETCFYDPLRHARAWNAALHVGGWD
jgi:hypothetical protein